MAPSERRRHALFVCVALAACDPAAPTSAVSSADVPARRVTLAVANVSVERSPQHALFRCDATLSNDTGAPLDVLSNFSSAFDGLTLVVSSGGREIVRRAYVHHQSPYAEDQVIVLPVGRTTKSIVFPIEREALTAPSQELSVQLVGGLRGTDHADGLASNVVVASPYQFPMGASPPNPRPSRR